MDGLAEGAPLTVACLPASLPACQPSLVSLSASQPRTLPTFSTLTLQRAPDSQSKPSRVSTESKRTSTSHQENLTSPVFWNRKHESRLSIQSRESLLYHLKQDPRQRSAVNSRNLRWYDQVLFLINLQEPRFPPSNVAHRSALPRSDMAMLHTPCNRDRARVPTIIATFGPLRRSKPLPSTVCHAAHFSCNPGDH